jgi:hypothetical protein
MLAGDSHSILETYPDALPSDRNLKWWVRLGSLMEDSSHHFSDEDHLTVREGGDGSRILVRKVM